ncbi:GNAT family N-acetyltransferase [Microbacterium sp. SA39]|uniref:GNAT family N-acetyltransferase n=1 Tax=Microbacterium sp. SA39 TaxID=1263625 RepID=UPI0005F9BEBD|nr:GNAT family N-acetyltransferase [Microbacterium sp. SA39]KJQ53051.1 ribosomal-protein-L7/L12-serine acetyltransferase [Microbacterium sp. SA39]
MEPLALRPWHDDDLPLLHRANTLEMTSHLNGPETDEQIADRHARYLRYAKSGEARMFAILLDSKPVGSVGYWRLRWKDRDVWETGWFVLPEAQGQRVAARALALLIDDVRRHPERRDSLVAFPSVDNPPSNAVCRRAGFELTASSTETFRGAELTVNEWVYDLTAPRDAA